MIACSTYQTATTRKTVNWFNHFEELLNDAYGRTLKMFSLWFSSFRKLFQVHAPNWGEGNILHIMFIEALFMIMKYLKITHNKKKTNNLIKKWSKEVNRHFTKWICGWKTSTRKDVPLLITREIPIKTTIVITTCLLEG